MMSYGGRVRFEKLANGAWVVEVIADDDPHRGFGSAVRVGFLTQAEASDYAVEFVRKVCAGTEIQHHPV
jgi:hypothetical protein